jgi:hypothetical protein
MPSKRPIVAKIREAMRALSVSRIKVDRRNHTNSYVNIVHGTPISMPYVHRQ